MTPEERRQHAAEAHSGWPARGGGRRLIAKRAALAAQLWTRSGVRRLAAGGAFDEALTALPPEELDWIFELSPLGPLYLLPTRRWVQALAKTIRGLGARRVLEVAAGDGFLSAALARNAPDIEVIATDSGAWEEPAARMSAAEQKKLRRTHVPGLLLGGNVQQLEARKAIRKFAPDLVLASWLPPGDLLDHLVRAPVSHVLEIGASEGVTASAWSWRFAHDFLEGPIESLARCRLDVRPREQLYSRVTLYFGKNHPDHFCERVRPGDWLWQFKPEKDASRR